MSFSHAVILGGSVAGLLSAAALSTGFDTVTIVERDRLPDAPATRRGVPQAEQVHQLMPAGLKRIEELLPGFGAELLAQGCERYEIDRDIAVLYPRGWSARVAGGMEVIGFLRPTFEWVLRQRVLALPNVRAVRGIATGLLAGTDGTTVTGAKVTGADGEKLDAELVVDATGRGSQAPKWLSELGYAPPAEQHVRPFLGYATTVVRLPEGALPAGLRGIAATPHPMHLKGGVILPCGDGRHVVAAMGVSKNYPPAGIAELLDFLDEAPSPLLGRAVRAAELIVEPVVYRMPGNQRRLWEQLDRRPEGFVVTGDAVAAFNPIYAQGMTVAAIGASLLARVIAAAGGSIAGVAEKFAAELAPWTDYAFAMAANTDSFFPGTEFENFTPPDPAAFAGEAAAVAAATTDPAVAQAMRRAAYYMDPADMQSPAVWKSITEWATTGRQPDPALTDPNRPPGTIHTLD
ncbi:FAD-dependent oxidoreductase [Nocardia carnea]|uniref:FAD-dependent oxidoreductase n=1 Tax=Nocardia carnea TaxID=37328 RepID=UPI0024583999|nr:FAD-dependent monooxygenase [Nocardia carnea]